MTSSFIYEQNKQNKTSNNNDKYYCQIGHENFIDSENNPRIKEENSDFVLAKAKYKVNGQPKYLIKLDHNKKLFNPSIMISDASKNKPIDLLIPNNNGFKEVSQKVFDLYLSFLRTSNTSWINHAEREDF